MSVINVKANSFKLDSVMKIENNIWLKSKGNSSIFFRTHPNFGFGFCNNMERWVFKHLTSLDIWEEASATDVLKSINKGLKSKGYSNNIMVKPCFSLGSGWTMEYPECNELKFKNFYFNFKSKFLIDQLMKSGNLFLQNKNGDMIRVLFGGEFVDVSKKSPYKFFCVKGSEGSEKQN